MERSCSDVYGEGLEGGQSRRMVPAMRQCTEQTACSHVLLTTSSLLPLRPMLFPPSFPSQPERPMMMSLPRFGGGSQAAPATPSPGDETGVKAGSVDAAAAPPPPPLAEKVWEAALLDFITAFQTKPYNLRLRPHSDLAATWDESITVDEDPQLLQGSG